MIGRDSVFGQWSMISCITRSRNLAATAGSFPLENISQISPKWSKLFGIASNTKAFTTAALAILVDEGKLHWDDKVIDHLPEFRLYDGYVTREFTIRDLVTHRSGLGLGAGDLMFFPNSDFTTKDIVHALRYLKPVSGFRAEYAYDNSLYIVAGELIPAITGQTWADFVTTRILAPLNMAPCVALPQRVSDHRKQASPHASVEGRFVPITPDDTSANAAAAAIQCNVTQLAKWQLAQLGHGQASGGARIFSEVCTRGRPREARHRPFRRYVQGCVARRGVGYARQRGANVDL